jgi:rhamnosyl/mannosyltransferase
MRVLHFYKTSSPDSMGGVEHFISQLCSGVNELGIKTKVLSLAKNPKPDTIVSNMHSIHRAKLNFEVASTGFSLSAFYRFAQLAIDADLIHYHFPWPFMDLVHLLNHVKKPSVVTYHSDIIRQKYLCKIYSPLMHKFLSSVDGIACTSKNYLLSSDVLAQYQDKVHVIPIGLDKASYPQVDMNRLQYWSNQFGPKFFLFVGVIRYYKGLHVLLEALAGTTYPVVIVGQGPAEDELKARAQELNLNHVHFVGAVSDVDKVALFKLCYALVFPSHLRSEAFGIGLLEGAMFGKPMISCEIGTGTSYINKDKLTGLVVPPSDPLALRNSIDFLWEHPDQALEMGKNAEKRYWSLFQANTMVHSYVDLYGQLISEYDKSYVNVV